MTEKTDDAAPGGTTAGNEFDQLLAELDQAHEATLAKAMPAAAACKDDDKDDEGKDGPAKVEAAAAEAGVDTKAAADKDADGDKDDDDDEQSGDFAKSFKVRLEDGSEVDALDATEIVKSLDAAIAERKGETAVLLKATARLGDMVRAQGEQLAGAQALIKSLQGEVKRLGSSGSGRRAMLTVHEKATTASASAEAEKPAGIAYPDAMAKALSLQATGKMTGAEVCQLQAYANRGVEIPADILRLLQSA